MPEASFVHNNVKMENTTMKLKNLLMSGVAVAAMALVAVGCNENTTNPPGGSPPSAPTNLQVVSISSTSVGLKWTASTTASVTYTVTRVGTGTPLDSNVVAGLATVSTTLNGLTAREYSFSVVAVDSNGTSSPITVKWAPATRHVADASGATTLRLYEKASSSGSGMTIDPALGGPKNVSMIVTAPGVAQLAMFLYTDKLVVGPAYAIPEYGASGNFNPAKVDSSTYVAKTSVIAAAPSTLTLDNWYGATALNQLIKTADGGNVIAYEFTNSNQSVATGFYVRTGSDASGNQHYARVLITANGGQMVQGTSPNRYIEVQISYQNAANVPYAKRSITMQNGPAAKRLW